MHRARLPFFPIMKNGLLMKINEKMERYEIFYIFASCFIKRSFMKKLKVFLPIIIAVLGVVLFSQCKKDHSCKMRITCKYSINNVETDSVVPFAIIMFDTIKYNPALTVDSLISRVSIDTLDRMTLEDLYNLSYGPGYNYKAGADGVFEYTLKYPALLIVNTIKVDKDTSMPGVERYVRYTGTTQVQVNEGETTEKTIYMVETN